MGRLFASRALSFSLGLPTQQTAGKKKGLMVGWEWGEQGLEMFSVPPFFPESLSQGAAIIDPGQNRSLKTNWQKPVIKNNLFQKIATLYN